MFAELEEMSHRPVPITITIIITVIITIIIKTRIQI